MATTVTWQDAIGPVGTPGWANASFLRFNNSNARLTATATTAPMVKPTGANHDYSYEKWCRIAVTEVETSVSNLKLVSTTAYGTGTGAAGLAGCQVDYGFATAYATPTGVVSTIATNAMTASLSAVWETSTTTTATLVATATKWRKYVVFQLDVTSSVVAGEKSFGNITARYDKI